MKKLTLLSTSLLALSTFSTPSFADAASDDYREAKAGYQALSNQLEVMGYEAEEVSFSEPMTFSQKESVYIEKTHELQSEFNRLN